MRKLLTLAAGLLWIGLLSACNFSLAGDITPPPGYTPPPASTPTNSAAVSPTPSPVSTLSPGGEAVTATSTPQLLTPPAGTSLTPPSTTATTVVTITGTISFDPGVPSTLPGGLLVSVQGFDGTTQAVNLSAPINADHTFRLPGVDVPSGRVFMASITLNQVTYSSEVGQVTAGSNEINLPITVHATTTDASSLSVDRMHVFLDFSTAGYVQVVELFIISNPTGKVIVPEAGKSVINFTLPSGATNLQFQSGQLGQRYLSMPNGFGDTATIAPGVDQHQVLFAYDLAYSNQLPVSLPVPLPVNAAVVLLPQNGITVQSSQLVDNGVQNIQGSAYRIYAAQNLAKGADLTFDLIGQPQSASSSAAGNNTTTNLIIGGGVLLFSLVVVGWWLYRSGGFTGRKLKPAVAKSPVKDDPDSLIDAILALDDLHKDGFLPEPAYQSRRAELKKRLKASYQGDNSPGQEQP